MLPHWVASPLKPCGSQKVMHTRKRHSELYHELNQKFHTFDRYRSQSTAKVRAPPVVAPARSSGPGLVQWPLGSDPDPWPPLQREKRWSVSSGGAAERSVSSVSPPGLDGGEGTLRDSFPPYPSPRLGQPQPASTRAYPWHKQQLWSCSGMGNIDRDSTRVLRRVGRQETWSQGATSGARQICI